MSKIPVEDRKSCIYYRKDLGEWAMFTVGDLARLVKHLELPDDWELWPNDAGNLIVFRPTETSRYYVGYIDLTLMQAFIQPDAGPDDEGRPGVPAQWPPRDALRRAQRRDGSTYRPVVHPDSPKWEPIFVDPRSLNSLGPDDV